MSFRVLISPEAENDLRGIYRYIADTLLAPEAAAKQARRILSEIKSLAEFPLRNPVVKRGAWKKRGLRQLFIDNFIAFYLTNEQTQEVVVFRIFYNRRNTEKLL